MSTTFRILRGALALLTLASGCAIQSEGPGDPEVEVTGTTTQALGVYDDYVTSLNPVAWYKFDEVGLPPGANVYDSSGRGNHGQLYNAGTNESPMRGNPSAVQNNGYSYHFGSANAATATKTQSMVHFPAFKDLSITKGSDSLFRASTTNLTNNWGSPSLGLASGSTYAGSPEVANGIWTPLFDSSSTYCAATYGACVYQYLASPRMRGQLFPSTNRLGSDTRVAMWWPYQNPGLSGMTQRQQCGGIFARYVDANNYYRADLCEYATYTNEYSHPLYISITRVQNGSSTLLKTAYIGEWGQTRPVYLNLRFQVSNDPIPVLKARWWPTDATNQGATWQLDTTNDGITVGITSPGKNGVFSDNAGSDYWQTPFFRDFRLQSPGMTVSAWVRSTNDNFNVGFTGDLCGGTTGVKENYNAVMAKNAPGNLEYWVRHYSSDQYMICPTTPPETQNRKSSFSIYNAGTNYNTWNPNSKGSGSRWNPCSPDTNPTTCVDVSRFHHIVGMYDPGDFTDPTAGVRMYVDGVQQGPNPTVPPAAANDANYAFAKAYNNSYQSDNHWTSNYLTIGGGYTGGVWTQFYGDIDEVTFYDYLLTPVQIQGHYLLRAVGSDQ